MATHAQPGPSPSSPPLKHRVSPRKPVPLSALFLPTGTRDPGPSQASTFQGAPPVPFSDHRGSHFMRGLGSCAWVERGLWQESFSGGARGTMDTPIWLSGLQVTCWAHTRAPQERTSQPLPKYWPDQLGSCEGSPNSTCSRYPRPLGLKGFGLIENIGDFINFWLGD